MVRTPPTLEELKNAMRALVNSAREQLEAGRDVLPVVLLGDALDGSPNELIGVVLNSPKDKQVLADFLRKRINSAGFSHAIMVSDSRALTFPTNDDGRAQAKLASWLMKVKGMSMEAVSRAGCGKFEEHVSAILQTTDGRIILMLLPYERDGEGKLVFHPLKEEAPAVNLVSRFKFY